MHPGTRSPGGGEPLPSIGVTLRLTVDTGAWQRHIDAVVAATDGLVPVVKGNGYGFGRSALALVAATMADTIAVGTVHELDVLDTTADIAAPRAASGAAPSTAPGAAPSTAPCDVTVLTPTLHAPDVPHDRVVLTVGSSEHVAALAGWPGRVVVKVASAMRRYGEDPDLLDRARDAGLDVIGWSIHPPLAGTDRDRLDEITALLPHLDPGFTVWLSHLAPDALALLPDSHRYRLRVGTWLWHGDKSALHLNAEVLAIRPVAAGDRAGYRLVPVPTDGTLVMVGAGSAHGVAPLADGRSPFHHRRRRVDLLEPPHMHTSMLFVPDGDPVPEVGERIDVQRPLITTHVDHVEWV